MSENTKLKLNLKWLQQQTSSQAETQDSGNKDIENSSNKNTWKTRRFELSRNYYPPLKALKLEEKWGDTTTTQKTNTKKVSSSTSIKDNNQVPEEEKKKSWKLSFSAIAWNREEKKKDDEKNTEKSEEKKVWKNKSEEEKVEKKQEEEIKFTNYKSNFKDESENILKRLQRFKYTPKTRVGFVVTMVMITTLSIWSLMIFFPEKHSFEIYRSSLLILYDWNNTKPHQNDERSIDTQVSDNNQDTSGWDDVETIENWDIEDIDIYEDEMQRIRRFLIERYQ